MKIRAYYVKKKPPKNLKFEYDDPSKGRPAWIQIKGLPNDTHFINTHLGKRGKKGRRLQFYKTYLPSGLFLPIDYTKEEMKKFYDKFAEIYDKMVKENKYNIKAGKFLCKKLKKYIKEGSVLDLGAGTGLITEFYFDAGFNDITLIDYSKGMLEKAKKKKKLGDCKFILGDIKKLNLKKRYDIIISHFSLGLSSYFDKNEFVKTIKLVKQALKPGGVIAVLGMFDQELFEEKFKKLESGIYTLDKKMEFYTDYFIGRKKS